MVYVVNIWNDPISYAGQEHVPLFLHVTYHIHKKSNKCHVNSLQGWIGQSKQAMYQQEGSMVTYETRRPRSSMTWNYTNNGMYQ